MALGALLAVADYTRVTTVFRAAADAPPLAQRIASGQRSLFFGHHADYAAVTSGMRSNTPAAEAAAFARATHYLLDTRLMLAWASAREAAGDEDGARHLAARLREFRNAGSREFFEACDVAGSSEAAATTAAPADSGSFAAGAVAPAPQSPPFQCLAPEGTLPWKYFLRAPAAR